MSAFPQPTDPDPINFRSERDKASRSWERSHPDDALIEPFGRFGYKVCLRDGEDVHYCALGLEDGQYIGRCDCKGWQYHNGPCAHLCTLRKAAFLDRIDVAETDDSPDDEHAMHQATSETFDGEQCDASIEHAQGREVCR